MEALQDSCVVNHFQQFADLTPEEIHLLTALEKDPRVYPADTAIASIGSVADRFFTLRSGWACAIRTLADGQRQVLDIFLPGQIMGLREIGFDRNLSELYALTEVKACSFPRQRLTDIFDQAPRLTDLFFLNLAREQSMLIERVVNIGRRNAAERLAHFIIEMKTRLNQKTNAFMLPMNQTVIGDALSLSSVHVSRTFKHLKSIGLISTKDGIISIQNLDGLIDFSGFDRSYLDNHSS